MAAPAVMDAGEVGMPAARTSMAVTMLLVLTARESLAGGPAALNSTVPSSITLVGSVAGTPDGAGAFTVVARDPANNPLNGCSVVLDLSGCSDLILCSNQLDAGALVNCAAKTMRKFSNISGSVSFTVLGSSTGAGNATTLLNGAKIYWNGTLLGSPTVSALDLDGANGVGINDLSVWLSDYGTLGNPPFGRSNFDGDRALGVNDLSVWVTAFGAGGSTQGCASICP